MDFLIGVIDEVLGKCQGAEQYVIDLESFVRNMEHHGDHINLASADVKKDYDALIREEDRLKSAKHDYSVSREITGRDVIPIRKHILPAYKQHLKAKKGPKPIFESTPNSAYVMLCQDIRERNSDISCVVYDGKRIFDPRILDKWIQGDYQEGTEITFYLHNLNGNNHKLEDFATLIGPIVPEEKKVVRYHQDVLKLLKREKLDPKSLVKNEKYGNAKNGFFAYVVPENEYGLHARPAALFVKKASEFDSDILVYKGKEKRIGKSIMGMMSIEGTKGSDIIISVIPDKYKNDSEPCIDALIDLFKTKFGED